MRLRGMPVAPVEIADEVELYARESGRHATLHFIPTLFSGDQVLRGTWMVKFTLRSDDKRMQLYQQGKVADPPTEDVWLHEADPSYPNGYRSFDLMAMGATGVRTFLEKGNTWSGRGAFRSIEEVAREAMAQNAKMREKNRADNKEANRYEQRDLRRSRLKIPFLPVGVDLSKVPSTTSNDLVGATTVKEQSA